MREGRDGVKHKNLVSVIKQVSLPFCPSPDPPLSRLYVQWRFRVGVEKQFMALQKGFHELIPPHLLKMFDEKELELLISGLGKVDVEDWKANTRLKHCTHETNVIQWFWEVRRIGGEVGRRREEGGKRGGRREERRKEGRDEEGGKEGRKRKGRT